MSPWSVAQAVPQPAQAACSPPQSTLKKGGCNEQATCNDQAAEDPSASIFDDETSLWEESVGSGRVTPPYLRPELSEGVDPARALAALAATQANAEAKLKSAREAAHLV